MQPEARTSCTRCQRRKKRCDRILPACKNCQGAHVRCSFQDNKSLTVASYPIAYVRDLEARLQDLESQLGECSTVADEPQTLQSPSMLSCASSPQSRQARAGSNTEPQRNYAPAQHQQHPSLGETQLSFAQELKTLSLEAAAERHVGSSSGVSFAKLTQKVLSRLTPDKADFVFGDHAADMSTVAATATAATATLTQTADVRTRRNSDMQVIQEPSLSSAGSPIDFISFSDLFNTTMLQSLNETISLNPLLFSDVIQSEGMQLDKALDDQIWPSPDNIVVATNIAKDYMQGDLAKDSTDRDEAHKRRLVDFYFSHSNTLYPLIVRSEFMETLQAHLWEEEQHLEREGTEEVFPALSPLSRFRVWMVLAIGATALSSVSLTEESEPLQYYNKALQYSEEALALDEVSALEVLTLQVSYSFFNQLGPNTWFLVGMAARVAVGLGLHSASSYEKLHLAVAERRKRLFYSIYMMDRVVSIALGRPFAMHDDDIDVQPFATVDDDGGGSIDTTSLASLQPPLMSVPRHILSLRQIASRIAQQVYSSSAASRQKDTLPEQRMAILTKLHEELLSWRRSMPFPLPDVDGRVPHLCSAWYDFNYYTHLAALYRPSPLCPVLDAPRVRLLKSAASRAVRHAHQLHQQHRFAYNWLNLLALFTATLSLIYAITAQPDQLASVLRESHAIDDLELALELFDTLSVKFVAAHKIRRMVAEICARYKDMVQV